jgi:AmmeMemoRadiSam system protein B
LVLLTLKALGRRAHYQEIGYATSGDVSGDRSRVVGYAGVLF